MRYLTLSGGLLVLSEWSLQEKHVLFMREAEVVYPSRRLDYPEFLEFRRVDQLPGLDFLRSFFVQSHVFVLELFIVVFLTVLNLAWESRHFFLILSKVCA